MVKTISTQGMTMEDIAIIGLRGDLSSIKQAGYNRKFAREMLYHRYVVRDKLLAAAVFTRIVNSVLPE